LGERRRACIPARGRGGAVGSRQEAGKTHLVRKLCLGTALPKLRFPALGSRAARPDVAKRSFATRGELVCVWRGRILPPLPRGEGRGEGAWTPRRPRKAPSPTHLRKASADGLSPRERCICRRAGVDLHLTRPSHIYYHRGWLWHTANRRRSVGGPRRGSWLAIRPCEKSHMPPAHYARRAGDGALLNPMKRLEASYMGRGGRV
jgi:hypothetical protein